MFLHLNWANEWARRMFDHFHESKRIELNRIVLLSTFVIVIIIWICCVLWWFWFFVIWTLLMNIQLDTVQDYYSLMWYVRNRDITHTHTYSKEKKKLKQRNQTEDQTKKTLFVSFFRGAVTPIASTVVFLFDFNHELFFALFSFRIQ